MHAANIAANPQAPLVSVFDVNKNAAATVVTRYGAKPAASVVRKSAYCSFVTPAQAGVHLIDSNWEAPLRSKNLVDPGLAGMTIQVDAQSLCDIFSRFWSARRVAASKRSS